MNEFKKIKLYSTYLSLALLFTVSYNSLANEWSGYVAAEIRAFTQDTIDSRQHDNYISISAQPEYYHEWDNGRFSFTLVPFLRVDQYDDERNHIDLREITIIEVANDWELRIGLRKVFWGVTESQHLVDIINQTDLVENPDGEEKLGQPMINLALIQDWGTLDFFILTGFRERTFPDTEGRLRTHPYVASDQAIYESKSENRHIDTAFRWSNSIGDWDIALSHFNGTNRDPSLLLGTDKTGNAALIPFYEQIDQTGLELQTIKGNWLWKLETIQRSRQGPRYVASTSGIEYTFYGLSDTVIDLGIVAEYLYDERGNNATSPFQDDLMLGLRFTLNDVQSTEALIGTIIDLKTDSSLFSIEASRRFGENWKLNVEVRSFNDISAADPLFGLRNDDFIQTELAYYF